jgi:hypothetical protein
MEHEAGMPTEPGPQFGVLVAAVIVEDDMDELAGRDLGLERIEEANELLMRVALHAATDDPAVETSNAANSVVVPLRLWSWVIVPARPFSIGRPA